MSTQPPTAIAVAVVRQGDRVLIGPRPDGVPLAGYWEFPGGKLLPEETPANAAIRECFEEAGMRIRVSSTAAVVEHRYEHACLRIHFVNALPVNPESPPQSPFRWIPITELHEYRFPPANDAILESLGAQAE